VSYTARHLFQRVAEHEYLAIRKHFLQAHSSDHVLRKCHLEQIQLFIIQNALHQETQPYFECSDELYMHKTFCLTSSIFFAIVLISILRFVIS